MGQVCLADILDRWHAAKHYERGAVLYILADADRSAPGDQASGRGLRESLMINSEALKVQYFSRRCLRA